MKSRRSRKGLIAERAPEAPAASATADRARLLQEFMGRLKLIESQARAHLADAGFADPFRLRKDVAADGSVTKQAEFQWLMDNRPELDRVYFFAAILDQVLAARQALTESTIKAFLFGVQFERLFWHASLCDEEAAIVAGRGVIAGVSAGGERSALIKRAALEARDRQISMAAAELENRGHNSRDIASLLAKRGWAGRSLSVSQLRRILRRAKEKRAPA